MTSKFFEISAACTHHSTCMHRSSATSAPNISLDTAPLKPFPTVHCVVLFTHSLLPVELKKKKKKLVLQL
jgi:hypothetical protein